jgi:probable F420-dependent oxidoreductase
MNEDPMNEGPMKEDPMKIDISAPKDISAVQGAAARAEEAGFDGLWVAESQNDPFLSALRVADATRRMTVGTSVAIAFARTPMTLAYTGWDLAGYAEGRFVLGLGSQVKPHIERRFSMPWSHPAARMRELILALRAIWSSWEDGSKLDFQGDYYTHTLMTPFFTPERHGFGPPPVYLAGVGRQMTEVAGEVADGFFFHPFTTSRYLAESTLPALEAGRRKAGSTLEGFEIAGPAFACAGRDEAELARAVQGTKAQIAFYASTPAYRPVLELHGWGELQPELTRLSKEERWQEMGDAIDDEVLHAFAVVGDPKSVGAGLKQRWSTVATRITLYTPYPHDPELLALVADAAR